MSRILVIDDEEFFRTFLFELLTRHGHEVEAVETGAEALKAAESGTVDVALLDYSLVNETGLEILGRLKSRFPSLPVIVVTGQVDVNVAVSFMKGGACDYVTKPFDNEVLLQKVHRALALP